MSAIGDRNDSIPSTSSSLQTGSEPCRHFEFSEIQQATNNFNESLVIGHGGFGKVYKGNFINGSSHVIAAVKRLDYMSNQGATEFWAEVEMLSKLRHCNLVSLIGYCNYGKEMVLVYEYMPNGTLEDHLHKLGTPLSWLERLKICIGASRGLHYLHTGTGIHVGVIHRDVKSSNILLHENWAAKISDFGLSKIGQTNRQSTYVKTIVKGTFGYLDPDYYATGKLTRKSDVYAFGVVLLEVLCRKRAVDSTLDEEQWLNLARWAQESINQGNLKHIIDSDIRGQISPKCLKEFVRIARRCLHNNPKKRSTMAEVVVNLESVLNSQEKFNNSAQTARKTIFGRMVNMLPFPFNGENYGKGRGILGQQIIVPIAAEGNDRKLSSNTKGNRRTAGSAVGADENMFSDEHCNYSSLETFKFADLKWATRNFSQDLHLGSGDSAKVFLGWIDHNTLDPSTSDGHGNCVAVKRFNKGRCHVEQSMTEASLLGRLSHPNIIRLLGYCNDEKHEYILVYEYMQNRSFDRFLFTTAKPLSWGIRLIIMIGVARGLTYLHSSKNQVIWRGVKTSNILLDQDFNAKLWDFGLAKIGPKMGKTRYSKVSMEDYVYVAPEEYLHNGNLTVKSDIYGFGVVLLETLTGLRMLDSNRPNDQHGLVDWASQILARRETLEEILDPRLERNYPLVAALKYVELTLRCLADKPKDRPSSEEVLQHLEQIYDINK